MKKPIYYDTETTGTRPETDRIIEIAAYDPINDKSFSALINPGMPIPQESTAIHGITDEMVSAAPSFSEVAKEFCLFCEGDVVLIAHNNEGFDKPILEAELKRASLPVPPWAYLDTLKWSRKYRPDLPRHSLQHLREVYQIPANNAHRALDDVMVLYRVFSLMTGDLSIETVLTLLKQEGAIRQMPFGKHKGALLKDVPQSYVKWLMETGAFEKPENAFLRKSFEKIGLLK